MGYYPSKICSLLQIVLMEGYGTLSCILGGQVLSAVSDGSMTIVVGVVIVAIIVGLFAAFGLKIFSVYERYARMRSVTLHSSLMPLADMLGYRTSSRSVFSSAAQGPSLILRCPHW